MDNNNNNNNISSKDGHGSYALSGKVMLGAIAVLFTIVILILFLHLYVRWHVIHRASRRLRRRRRLVFSSDAQTPAANRCLDPSILASLPVLLVSEDENYGESDSAECAVCLSEFYKDEKVRRLPRCCHRFHVDCIDMWFGSHSTCPLCRATVEMVVPAVDAVATTDAVAVEMGSTSSEDERDCAEGSSGQEERMSVGIESQPLKIASCRMVLIRWLLMRDPRVLMREQIDLERGDGELAITVADLSR